MEQDLVLQDLSVVQYHHRGQTTGTPYKWPSWVKNVKSREKYASSSKSLAVLVKGRILPPWPCSRERIVSEQHIGGSTAGDKANPHPGIVSFKALGDDPHDQSRSWVGIVFHR